MTWTPTPRMSPSSRSTLICAMPSTSDTRPAGPCEPCHRNTAAKTACTMARMADPPDHIVLIVDDDRGSARRCPSFFRASTCTRSRSARPPSTWPIRARRPGLPHSRCGASGHQRTGSPKPDRTGESSAHRVHHRTRRHSVFRSRDQDRRGRLLTKPFKEADLCGRSMPLWRRIATRGGSMRSG